MERHLLFVSDGIRFYRKTDASQNVIQNKNALILFKINQK